MSDSPPPPPLPPPAAPLLAGARYHRSKVLSYLLIHLLCLSALWVPFSWDCLAVCAGAYAFRILGITAGFHRYFAHRSYSTSRAFQLLLALWANTAFMRGPITWARAHRHHHRASDGREDFHSPRQLGLWFAHTGWFLTREYDEANTLPVRDLTRFPELVWLDRFYWVPTAALLLALWLWGGAPYLVWGGLIGGVLAWHGTFTINSLAHRIGRQRYATGDESRNSLLLAVLTMGEGWHNNHHHDMHAARQGHRRWEWDPTWYLIWVWARLGLVWDVVAVGERGRGAARPGEPDAPLPS
ncbi:MAG: acyl-CoA desaturase [Planctomycetota bacterium]